VKIALILGGIRILCILIRSPKMVGRTLPDFAKYTHKLVLLGDRATDNEHRNTPIFKVRKIQVSRMDRTDQDTLVSSQILDCAQMSHRSRITTTNNPMHGVGHVYIILRSNEMNTIRARSVSDLG
jgi:hypothetical protein